MGVPAAAGAFDAAIKAATADAEDAGAGAVGGGETAAAAGGDTSDLTEAGETAAAAAGALDAAMKAATALAGVAGVGGAGSDDLETAGGGVGAAVAVAGALDAAMKAATADDVDVVDNAAAGAGDVAAAAETGAGDDAAAVEDDFFAGFSSLPPAGVASVTASSVTKKLHMLGARTLRSDSTVSTTPVIYAARGRAGGEVRGGARTQVATGEGRRTTHLREQPDAQVARRAHAHGRVCSREAQLVGRARA